MSTLLQNLNENQRAAVENVSSHLRIIAGAGSGKTRVITTRIAHLIQDLGVYAPSVLAITFTNKAANEMKERLHKMLGQEGAGVTISTIHALCVKILREDIYVFGYPRNFTIADTDDQKTILKEAYALYGVDVKAYSYNHVLSYISNCKTAKVSCEEAVRLGEYNEGETLKAKVYTYYQKRLQDLFALDFDDLLLKTEQLLREHADRREKWQRRFDYLHVDEFQDVDAIQYSIVRSLVKESAVLCVVGDPDQTIYTWRGAKVDIIMNFERDFPHVQTIYLNENYRSNEPILQAANSVIKHNKNRLDKALFTQKKKGQKVIHYSAFEEAYEPKWVVDMMAKLHEKGVSYADMAILYRSNYLSRSLEKLLLERNIPYIIYGGIRFYDRAEIKDVLSYLRMLLQADDLAFKRIINVPKRKIGPKTVDTIFQYAQEHGCSMYEAIQQASLARGKTQATIQAFVEVIESHRLLVNEISISKILESIVQKSGYLHSLEEDKEVERIENIKELINDIIAFETSNPNAGLDEYLQMIALYSDTTNDKATEAVPLMTIHAAKGLEFDNVFVYGMSDGVFPSERAMVEGGQHGLEEERRLAYVAFTRARKRLYLSDARGYSYVLDKMKITSRFIQEIDEDYIEHLGAGNPLESSPIIAAATNNATAKRTGAQKIRKGDLIVHDSFGEGIVIKVEEGLASIAFDKKFGIRKLVATHPSINKK
ncbi:MAG: ATP-dependent helicase [Erysipelotrichaceae bacterium]